MATHSYTLPEKDLHIFCVDDDSDFINSLSLFLPERMNQMYEGGDYLRFSFFVNPEEALEALKELQELGDEVALIISDQKMPEMKGTEFLALAKNYAPDASCVLLTGFAGIDAAVEAINGKLLDRYITKPIESENDFIINLLQMLNSYEMSRLIANQAKALSDLYEFSNTLNSITDYDEALDYIVSFTMSTLACERVSIMLLEGDGEDCLTIAASNGIPEEVVKSTRVKVGEGIAGRVMENREAVYAKDLTELGYVVESGGDNEAIFISMPLLWACLKSGEQAVGVINATDKTSGQVFSQKDLELLTYISNTASIAINNLTNSQKLKESFIETKTQAAALSHLMTHNSTTTLPNHQMLSSTLRRELESSAGIGLSLIILNLMRFRDINCSIGHHSGNTLLMNIGHRLEEQLIEGQHLFHIGGDEFAMLLPGYEQEQSLALIESIQKAFIEPIEIDGRQIDTDFTFGVACYPEHAREYKLLMQKADSALNHAKEKEKQLHIYDAASDKYNERRLAMVNELRHAIERDELTLHFQPKLNIDKGTIEGSEALVRWIHPEHGFTPPDQFIPLAEQMGLMEGLTEWVVRRAVQDCLAWNQDSAYQAEISVAVNLSTLNLAEENFAQKMLAICHEYGLSSHLLHFEITESVIMGNLEVALVCLNQLSDMGFQIHLDDFGTGYSSLAYIKRLPLNAVKIDRSFVMNISEDEQDVQIVQSVIELGHSLKLKLIAEGVENQQAVDLLKSLNCDTVQGYYYSRPLPLSDFKQWIKDF